MSSVTETFDVIVVGSGPGGCAAARRCAATGFKTLLLEKRKLPRDKVCTGMVMGPLARHIIQEEFGEIPPNVLTDPACLKGHMIHVPGASPRIIPCPTPMAWRRDLDFWFSKRAGDAGVEVLASVRVTSVARDNKGCVLTFQDREGKRTLTSRFLIGADGATSVVRRSLFPRLRVRYSSPIRECYEGTLSLDRDYCHWFFPKALSRPRFDINFKGDNILIEGSGIKELRPQVEETLENYGWVGISDPMWRDGCAIAILHEELADGRFLPARGNMLLVGDAAGLIFPVTYEGIGTALKTGLLAADAIAESIAQGREADAIYIEKLRPLLTAIEHLHELQTSLRAASLEGPVALADALKAAYEATSVSYTHIRAHET